MPIGGVYKFEEVQQAHRDMENGSAAGNLVVTTEGAVPPSSAPLRASQ